MKSKTKFIFLMVIMLIASLCSVCSASSNAIYIEKNNLTTYELELKKKTNVDFDQLINVEELQKNKDIAKKQQKESEKRYIEMVVKNYKKVDINNDLRTDIIRSNSWNITGLSNLQTDDGGSGVGFSESYWTSGLRNRNGSRAELYGTYWSKGWGSNYFTAPSTGIYDVTTLFNLTGRIIMGELVIKVKFIDIDDNNKEIEETFLEKDSGYYDNQTFSPTRSFYLKAGHDYIVVFEVETESQALAGVSMTDFSATELDGTQRNVNFEFLEISN